MPVSNSGEESPATSSQLVDERPGQGQAPRRIGGRWIDDWRPEDAAFWAAKGKSIAHRNLYLSIFAEFLGFVIWALWTIVVPKLNDINFGAGVQGFDLTKDQEFWLIAIPSLVGATLRIPYTLAVPMLGGRNWTIVSASLLIFPTVGLAWAVHHPELSFSTLMWIAALAGFGGGNFASSMSNISFFFPEKEKGRALGFNAAGGNIGTAAVQFAVPVAIGIGGAGVLTAAKVSMSVWMWLVLIIPAAILAWWRMDNLSSAKSDMRPFAEAVKNKHTWIISFLYIGTFGSFIGYSWAFPLVIKNTFPDYTTPLTVLGVPIALAFMGALVGSISRPAGGWISDHLGGTRVTIVSYFVMIAGALGAIYSIAVNKSFWPFFLSFLLLFVATGVGNGATYRMIPAVFREGARAKARGDESKVPALTASAVKAAAGCLGISGSIGAFGGFLIPRGFAFSESHYGSYVPAMWVFIGVYLVMAFVCWWVYGRRGSALAASRI